MAAKSIYDDGFKTGMGWKENYRPGGPAVRNPRLSDSETVKSACARSGREHAEWHQGFDDGWAKQQEVARG